MNKHIDILKTEVNHLRYWFILTCLSSYICDIFICKISKRFYNFFNFKCKKKLEHLTMAELRLNEQNIAVPNVSSIQQVLWSSQTGEGNLLFSVTIKLQYKLPHKLLLHLITYSIPTCMKVVPTITIEELQYELPHQLRQYACTFQCRSNNLPQVTIEFFQKVLYIIFLNIFLW